MLNRKRGVKFGDKIIPKYLKLESLLELIYNDITLDYTLLMPVLLFLPSFTTPLEVIKILINDYKKIIILSTRDSGNFFFLLSFYFF